MNILIVDYKAKDAPQKFAQSLKKTGFGILRNHPISWERIQKIYKEWLDFFHTEAKWHYKIDTDPSKSQDGYVPLGIAEKAKGATVKDIKEFYQLYFPNGRYPREVSDLSREYFYDVFELGRELCTWLEDYMPDAARSALSEPLTDMLSVEQTQLRVIHYPGLKGDEEAGAIRAAEHEDINLLTLLPAASEPGLQVIGSNGEWMDVVPDPGTLIINIGDMLQEATGHFYKSTTHRVLNPEGVDMTVPRLSMPMFVHPRPNVKLSDKYTAASYLDERLREIGLKM